VPFLVAGLFSGNDLTSGGDAMRAVLCHGFDGIASLRAGEVNEPIPAADDIAFVAEDDDCANAGHRFFELTRATKGN
jgi:hypothetical protein